MHDVSRLGLSGRGHCYVPGYHGQRHSELDLPEQLLGIVDTFDPDIDAIIESIHLLRSAGIDVAQPANLQMAVEAGRTRATEQAALIAKMKDAPQLDDESRAGWLERHAWVYYARVSDRVKIGYSTDPYRRVQTLGSEELLALEQGGPHLESRRHRQFADLRTRGEWFRYDEALVEHVASLAPVWRTKPTGRSRFRI